MARLNDNEYFRRMLLTCLSEPDPLLKMLQWVAERLAEMEAEVKVGAEKGKHTAERRTHFSGTRVRRFDTRLGSIYLLIPKLRRGGFIPFFMTERKRFEAAVIGVVQEAFIYGVNLAGKREILAVQPMYEESEASWRSVFDSLKARGVQRVGLVVADARQGIQNACRRHFLGSSYQRCKVHLMRTIPGRVSHKDKKAFAEKLKQIWVQPDRKPAVRTARIFTAEHRQKYPEAIAVLAGGLEDSLQFYALAEMDARKISSTNVLERLNKEIRRRSRVVGVFPSEESYVQLLCCYLIEHTEDWEHEKNYIRKEGLELIKARREEAA